MTAKEVLEKHCPSMNDLFLDGDGRKFRKDITEAMKEYAEYVHVSRILSDVDGEKLKCCGNCFFFDIVDNFGGVCDFADQHVPADRDAKCEDWKFNEPSMSR